MPTLSPDTIEDGQQMADDKDEAESGIEGHLYLGDRQNDEGSRYMTFGHFRGNPYLSF